MKGESCPRASGLFDYLFVIFAGIWTAGAYIDGWAHTHLVAELETFFTPWHAVFYGGVILTFLLLIIQAVNNHAKGFAWRYSLPKEYLFSLFGVIATLLAGLGDLAWHEVFGIEAGIEALLSPTHILLAIGGAMAVSGPLHAIWYRNREHKIHALPAVLSGAYFLAVIMFMLQFVHPFNFPWAMSSFFSLEQVNLGFATGTGVASMIIFSAVFMGLILSTIRHWRFPFGSFATILTLNVLAITLMHGVYYQFIYSALVAGIIIDLLYRALYSKFKKDFYLRFFSFLTPVIVFTSYFLTIFITDEIIWSTHMWIGAIFISGIVGFLMSYLLIAPEDQ